MKDSIKLSKKKKINKNKKSNTKIKNLLRCHKILNNFIKKTINRKI